MKNYNENNNGSSSEEKNLARKHSLVCNDELFMKDLMAIVDDTMRGEEDK